jgi:hypothetical protein
MHSFERSFVVCLLLVIAPRAHCEEAISAFLTHMPQNSDKRCVGITGVAEALLEGEQVAELKTSVNDLALRIYQNFTNDKHVRYPSHIDIGNQSVPIEDPRALEALSTRVAELYKADFYRWSESASGTQQLVAAQADVVRSRDELDQILQSDSDKTAFFCCFGKRTFPSGNVNETSHAVLIQPSMSNGYSIFDPNDPGSAIECEAEETLQGLTLTWECEYRDQEIKTTQRYLIVPQARYFSALD